MVRRKAPSGAALAAPKAAGIRSAGGTRWPDSRDLTDPGGATFGDRREGRRRVPDPYETHRIPSPLRLASGGPVPLPRDAPPPGGHRERHPGVAPPSRGRDQGGGLPRLHEDHRDDPGPPLRRA